MRRRLGLGLAGAAVVWLAVANNVDLGPTAAAAEWSRTRAVRTQTGMTAFYPRAWHAAVEGGGTLVIWSLGAPAERSADRVNRIPAGGVWIWLVNYGPLPRTSGFSARPRRFRLRDEDFGFQSCGLGFEGWNMNFVDHGSAVQAIVGLGSGAREADAVALLDRLEIRSPRVRLPT